jgi:hypothetical protein
MRREGRGRLCDILIETDRGKNSTSLQALGEGGVGRWCERPTGRRLGSSVQVRDRYFKRGGENMRGCARLRDEAEGMDNER